MHENIVYPIPFHAKHVIYTPQPMVDEDMWYHAVLGYPKCPLIGRYNKGEYQIGDIVLHLQFALVYN